MIVARTKVVGGQHENGRPVPGATIKGSDVTIVNIGAAEKPPARVRPDLRTRRADVPNKRTK